MGGDGPRHGLLAGEGRHHLASPQLCRLLLAALLAALTGCASLGEDREVRSGAGAGLGCGYLTDHVGGGAMRQRNV